MWIIFRWYQQPITNHFSRSTTIKVFTILYFSSLPAVYAHQGVRTAKRLWAKMDDLIIQSSYKIWCVQTLRLSSPLYYTHLLYSLHLLADQKPTSKLQTATYCTGVCRCCTVKSMKAKDRITWGSNSRPLELPTIPPLKFFKKAFQEKGRVRYNHIRV